MSIGENIKRSREGRGLSGAQLAREAGISTTALWHYERGDFKPPRPKLARIAAALLMDSDELETGAAQRATGLISVHFPDTLQPAATALLALLRALGVSAKPRVILDGGTNVLIRL